MASTLTTISDRVEQTLMDTANLIWDTAALTEGIRSAIGEYNTAALVDDGTAVAVTLNGLDSASATTLPAVHDTVIVWGAGAYCVQARAVDRADSYQLGSDPDKLKAWGDARLREFKIMLGAIFPKYLASAISSGAGGGTVDPAKTAAEIALLTAQAGLAGAQDAHTDGQESREAAAAAQAAADRAAEAARLADLRTASNAAWGSWADDDARRYQGEKPESSSS